MGATHQDATAKSKYFKVTDSRTVESFISASVLVGVFWMSSVLLAKAISYQVPDHCVLFGSSVIISLSSCVLHVFWVSVCMMVLAFIIFLNLSLTILLALLI